jgi:AmiR/NasT family two-component response regulator
MARGAVLDVQDVVEDIKAKIRRCIRKLSSNLLTRKEVKAAAKGLWMALKRITKDGLNKQFTKEELERVGAICLYYEALLAPNDENPETNTSTERR